MPPLAAVPKVVKFAFHHTFQEDTDVVNDIFLQYSGVMSGVDLLTVLTTVSGAWDANVMNHLSNSLVHIESHATDLSSSTSPTADIASTTAGGDTTHPSLAANSAIVVSQHIARRYRGGHPRKYLAGMHSNMLQDVQTLNASFITAMSTGWTAFEAACTAAPPAAVGTLTHVSVSYFSGFTNHTYPSGRVRPIPTPRGTPLVDPIIAFTVKPHIGSQRRRTLQSR
jgi:hypothetical protein